jgi:hypothetical protein
MLSIRVLPQKVSSREYAPLLPFAPEPLNEVGRATVDDVREFFRPYAEQFPKIYSNYGFDSWLTFLKASALIVQHDNVLEISDFGRDFLLYLTERRLLKNKTPW